MFVPGATVAYAALPRSASAEAAGPVQPDPHRRHQHRHFGHRDAPRAPDQVAWSEVGTHIHRFNPALEPYLGRLDLGLHDPQAPMLLAPELGRQAQMIGTVNALAAIAWSFLLMLPLAFLLPGGQPHRAGAVAQG